MDHRKTHHRKAHYRETHYRETVCAALAAMSFLGACAKPYQPLAAPGQDSLSTGYELPDEVVTDEVVTDEGVTREGNSG